MRTTLISAVCTAFVVAAFAFTFTYAQQAPTRGATSAPAMRGIAVIDVTYILDNYQRLKQATDAFKVDVEKTGQQFKTEQDTIAKEAEGLQRYNAGSPEYKQLEEDLAKRQSDLRIKAKLREKEFAERESQMYLAAYTELTNLVRAYAERNGISLVVRFNGKPVDRNNREAIRAELFKAVLYNSQSIDITDPILAALNRSAAAPTANRPGAAQRTRQ